MLMPGSLRLVPRFQRPDAKKVVNISKDAKLSATALLRNSNSDGPRVCAHSHIGDFVTKTHTPSNEFGNESGNEFEFRSNAVRDSLAALGQLPLKNWKWAGL
jgi:hypothetical protein